MSEIVDYEYTEITNTLVVESDLNDFLEDNDVISYELYEGDNEIESEE